MYAAWLEYISRVHQAVAGFQNAGRIAYLAWEDFWLPVGLAQGASSTAARLQLATVSGFRSWLRSTHSLAKISKLYGTVFRSWHEVPTPSFSAPAFSLMYQFDDWYLVHRLYDPAAARFPGLNLEARVDIDPVYDGSTVIGLYLHADTFKLPKTSFIGMYYSPYMGDSSSSLTETASPGDGWPSEHACKYARVLRRSIALHLRIRISTRNSPAVTSDPELSAAQIPVFIEQSESLLRAYASGYALWTYHDYNLSPIYNPSFVLGAAGWSMAGGARVQDSVSIGSSASLVPGSTISQSFPVGDSQPCEFGPRPVVKLDRHIDVPGRDAGDHRRHRRAHVIAIDDDGSPHSYQVDIPLSDVISAPEMLNFTLTTTANVAVTDVQAFAFTQVGDVYTTGGSPGVAAAPLRALNQELASG